MTQDQVFNIIRGKHISFAKRFGSDPTEVFLGTKQYATLRSAVGVWSDSVLLKEKTVYGLKIHVLQEDDYVGVGV